MTELIKIEETAKGTQVVNARELHNFLCVGKDFSSWIKDNLTFLELEENIDYAKISYDVYGKKIPLPKKGETGNQAVTVHRIEYVLTLDCAKHICLIQRSVKGKQARAYFIACEKELKNIKKELITPPDYPAALRAWADEIEKKLALEKKVETLKPLATMAEKVLASDKEVTMREVAGVINIKGLGRNKLFKLLRERKILSENNLPYRVYIERGYFRVLETFVGERLLVVTHVTQLGLQFILELIEEETPV